ncbi:MAG TPA: sn-glycerol-3-phosphate ABC transporter ATP-binding protein UgpC [Baekduia sp.]
MAEIQLKQVSKVYPDGYEAVKSLDLTVGDGEFMVLVGPSGCGKTTALRMIAGLEEITGGELLIDGQVANGRSPKDRDIAMVFQNYALYPHMTVRRNMGYALRLAKLPKAEIDDRVERAARILGLEEHLDRKPAGLSGGQRQRVAMGRAIVREPKAFLMDEPLSNLDAKLRVSMRAELSSLQTRLGTTTVYVTHDQIEAMTLGDRVAVMRAGVLQQVGAPSELYASPDNLFVAGFIGSPAMNFLTATVGGGVLRTALGELPLNARLAHAPEGRVVLGVRPEDLRAVDDGAPAAGAFAATVAVVEALGSDVYLHVDHAGLAEDDLRAGLDDEDLGLADGEGVAGRIVARLPGGFRAAPGEQVRLALDLDAIHLFEAGSGARVVPR